MYDKENLVYRMCMSKSVSDLIRTSRHILPGPTPKRIKIIRRTNSLIWRKGNPAGSIACTRKQQPRPYWSRSSVAMNDATPLTPHLRLFCPWWTRRLHYSKNSSVVFLALTFLANVRRRTVILGVYTCICA